VCDLWTVNRDKAVEAAKAAYGRAPRAFSTPEELLALPDVDAVLIATPEHSHSPILLMATPGRTPTARSQWEMTWTI
jgi:predicted dehydrogenase